MLELRELQLHQVDGYLASQHPAHGTVKAIMLHHCWKPNQTTDPYRGKSTMLGVQRAQRNRSGVSDIMANLYITPTGTVWTARPLSWENWAHGYVNQGAVEGRTFTWAQIEPEAKEIAYPNRQFFNYYAIGIEMIANFDDEPVDPPPLVLTTAINVIAIICRRWSLGPEHVFFHRDVSAKSCPGKQLRRGWVREQVGLALGGAASQQVKVVLRPGQLAGVLTLPAGGRITIPEDGDHRTDQGKLYLDHSQ